MKKLSLFSTLIMLFISATCVIGQRVNLSDFEVNARYLIPPETGFDSTVSVYHLEVYANENKLGYINRSSSSLAKQIAIKGYHKVEEPLGPKVEITFFGPNKSTGELTKKERKNRDGSKYTLYSYKYNFSFSANVRVLDEEGVLIKEFKEASMESKETIGKKSLKAAKQEARNKGRKIVFNGRKLAVDNVIKSINATLNKEWGLRPNTYEVEFEFPKKKKHHHFTKWEPYKENIKAAFARMKYTQNDGFLEEIQPAIDFWTEMAPTYPQDDRKLRKMNFACLYNTSLAYFWAEEFDEAKKYAQKVADGTYREGKGRRLLKDIEELEESLVQAGLPSLHFKVEIPEEIQAQLDAKIAAREAAIASGDLTQHKDFNARLRVKPESKKVPGTLHFKNGKKVKGYFVFEAEERIPDFRIPDKIRFGYLGEEGGIVRITMSYKQYSDFELDGKWFTIEDLLELETGIIDIKLENAIVYKGSEFEKTYMGIIYPPVKYAKVLAQKNELAPELFVYDKANKQYVPVRPTLLHSFPNSMKKVTGENCPEIMAYLENYYDREPDGSEIVTDEKQFSYAAHTYEVLKMFDACDGDAALEEAKHTDTDTDADTN